MDPRPPDRGSSAERPAELLTVTAAAQQTGLPRTIISGWITTGQLPAVRVNGRRHVRSEDLAATQARAHEGEVVPVWRQNRKRAGKRLRAIREAAGLNQIQLAAASGLTHEAISRLETGTVLAVRRDGAQAGGSPRRGTGAVRGVLDQIGLTMLTTAEAAARLDVPAGRVQSWLAEEAGRALGSEGIGAVAGTGCGGGGARAQWSAARTSPAARPAQPPRPSRRG